MDLQQYIDSWNMQADDWNQWDALDYDEKCAWIVAQANVKFYKIKTFIEAYSSKIFSAQALKDNGMTLDAISVSNLLLNGVKRILEE